MVHDYKDYFESTYRQYADEWRTSVTEEKRTFWHDALFQLEKKIMQTYGFEFADELHARYLG